jgi:hypothetical protein
VVDIEVDHRTMGACCAAVMAVDVATNISVVLNKAATEAVTAEEAKEEGPTDRLKERKRKTHPQQLFLRFPLVCPLTREVVANAN